MCNWKQRLGCMIDKKNFSFICDANISWHPGPMSCRYLWLPRLRVKTGKHRAFGTPIWCLGWNVTLCWVHDRIKRRFFYLWCKHFMTSRSHVIGAGCGDSSDCQNCGTLFWGPSTWEINRRRCLGSQSLSFWVKQFWHGFLGVWTKLCILTSTYTNLWKKNGIRSRRWTALLW